MSNYNKKNLNISKRNDENAVQYKKKQNAFFKNEENLKYSKDILNKKENKIIENNKNLMYNKTQLIKPIEKNKENKYKNEKEFTEIESFDSEEEYEEEEEEEDEDEDEDEEEYEEETEYEDEKEIEMKKEKEEKEEIINEKENDYDEYEINKNDILIREEIKELANICLEKNIPVTKENIQIVKKLRERKKLEEQINNNNNIKSLQEKRKILEEIEYHEWADREKRIKELQEKKIMLLKKIMEDKDVEKSEKIFYEVEKIMQRRDEKKDKIIEDFKKEKAKDMRNLFSEKKRNEKIIFNKKTDIIDQMEDYTSDYNLQLERNGIIPNKLNYNKTTKIDNLINKNNINNLDKKFNKYLYENFNTLDKKYDKYEKQKNTKLINNCKQYLNKNKKITITDDYYLVDQSDYQKVQTKLQYMKIQLPKIETKTIDEEKFEENILSFQSILRGKAIKKLIEDGIDSYSDLIDELKINEKLNKFSNEESEKFKKENFDSIKIDCYIENIQAKYISKMLDKLANQLEQYEEERKVAIMVKFAERERRLRESKEKGRREAEILLRQKEDYLFNEIMGLNNQTVDSYLEHILEKTIDDVSKEEALIKTKEKAQKLNDIYSSLENNEEQDKLIIKDLVGNFIIPYVDEQRGIEYEQLEKQKNNYVSKFATENILLRINEKF